MIKRQSRIISSDRVGKQRKQKSKIVIAVEGTNKTERLYFNNFDDGKKPYSIVVAKGNTTDPVSMVKRLAEEIKRLGVDLDDGDEAFCIFDTDIDLKKNEAIQKAIKYADKNKIKIITSSPSIELWFYLHYKYTTASMTNTEVIKRLKEYFPKYEKNYDIYQEICDNTDIAVQRAKKLEKYHIDNKKKIGMVETNPNTEIYKVIECLKKYLI